MQLTGQKHVQSAQVAPIESKRADGRGHRTASGINAVRELGQDRQIKPEVKEATKSAGIDGNLHRADLTPDERDEHIQEWHRLTEQRVK